MGHEIHAASGLLRHLWGGIEDIVEGGLDRLRQLLAAGDPVVKHLRPPHVGSGGKAVLGEAHQNPAGDGVDEGRPVFQIAHLFCPDRLSLRVVDGDVLPPGHPGVQADELGKLLHLQANCQIDLGLHRAVRPHRAAVYAAVSRVDDQDKLLRCLQPQIFGRVDGAPLPQNGRESHKEQEQREQIESRPFFKCQKHAITSLYPMRGLSGI